MNSLTFLSISFLICFISFSTAEEFESKAFYVPCTFTTPSGAAYDFSQIAKSKDIQTSGKRGIYYVGICHNTFHSCGAIESPVCISQPEPNFGFSSGGSLTSRYFIENDSGDIELHYSDGSQCPTNKSNRKTTIIFQCNPEAIEPKVSNLIEGCELTMTIESIEACPVKDTCRIYQSSSSCIANCACGWCPSEGGSCMGSDQQCYSSMTFGASCLPVSKPSSSSSSSSKLLYWLLPTVFGSVGLGLLIVCLAMVCGVFITHKTVQKVRLIRQNRRQQRHEFELLADQDQIDQDKQREFESRREARKKHQQSVDLLFADEPNDKPTAPELIDFSGATNVHESMYPQLQPLNPEPLNVQQQHQTVNVLPAAQQVMFYIPVTAQQFAQLPIEQQQAMLAALQQQQQQ